jgi:hypothetical protein
MVCCVIERRLVALLAIFASPRRLPAPPQTIVKFGNRIIQQSVAVCLATGYSCACLYSLKGRARPRGTRRVHRTTRCETDVLSIRRDLPHDFRLEAPTCGRRSGRATMMSRPLFAVVLIFRIGLYVLLRWCRSPKASKVFKAMMVIWITGAWLLAQIHSTNRSSFNFLQTLPQGRCVHTASIRAAWTFVATHSTHIRAENPSFLRWKERLAGARRTRGV